MNPHSAIIEKNYTAFSMQDAAIMAGCYHESILFKDPVFGIKGILLGWTDFMQNKIKAQAKKGLDARL